MCRGRGTVACPECSSKDKEEDKLIKCLTCNDSHVVPCGTCQGLGNTACPDCSGRGHVKAYLEVTAEIRTEESKEVVEAGGLTREYLQLLQGEVVYQYGAAAFS